jgi:hypothetical protein
VDKLGIATGREEARNLAFKYGFKSGSKVFEIIYFLVNKYNKEYVSRERYDKLREYNDNYKEEIKRLRKKVSKCRQQLIMLGITPDKKLFGEPKKPISKLEVH